MNNKYGKKHQTKAQLIDAKKLYPIVEALQLIKNTSPTKFDATVEIAYKLNIDPRHADQQLRGSLILPAGTGKTKKICVLTKKYQTEAKAAKADYVGDLDLINKIKNENWFDFDILIASPDIMRDLSKLGRLLGPKGLMPNLKTNTITEDIAKTVTEFKQGQITYRNDKTGNVHLVLGKVSFSEQKLMHNFEAVHNLIKKVKPASVKGRYIKNISLSTTMGPGIKVAVPL